MAANGISQELWNQLSIVNQQAYLASGAKTLYEYSPIVASLLLIGSNINDAFNSARAAGNSVSYGNIGGIQTLSSATTSDIRSSLTTGNYQVLPSGEIKYVQNSVIVAGPVSSTTTTPGSSTPGSSSIFDNIPKITVALTGIAAIDKLISKLNDGPSYLDTIKSVKDGSIFKTVSASMDDMRDTVSGLGTSATNMISMLKTNSLAAVSDITKDFGKYLSLAQTSMDMKAKAIISEGGIVTEADLISAAGPLKAITESVDSIKSAASDLASQLSNIESRIGMSVSEFKNLIPPIGSLEYDQFLIDHQDKLDLLADANNLVGNVSSGITNTLTSAASGLQDTIKSMVADLKAGALVMQLTQSSNPVIAKIKDQIIDKTKIDIANIRRTMINASKAANNIALPVRKPSETAVIPAGHDQLEPISIPATNKVDLVYKEEVEAFRNSYVTPIFDIVNKLKVRIENTAMWIEFRDHYDLPYRQLKLAKPDVSTWSAAELSIQTTRDAKRAIMVKDALWIEYTDALKLREIESNHCLALMNAYDNKSSRSVLDAKIRGRLIYEKDFAAASVYKT